MPGFELPPIHREQAVNYGTSFDGTIKEEVGGYGYFYSQQEKMILGGGNEDAGLELIVDEIEIYAGVPEELAGFRGRPLQEKLDELTWHNRLH